MSSGSTWRALFLLGRVSNLPTLFSNCLAGWLLGGGGESWGRLAILGAGAALLYTGGMYLNDAFDAQFDAQHRRERPIPSGAISEGTVWRIGFGLLGGGLVMLLPLGLTTFILSILLVASILLYDAIHKIVAFSPVLMALCRFLLYLVAASAAVGGITGLAIWSALALGFYVVGLSYLARKESTGVVIQRWPQLLILVPPILAWVVNDGASRSTAWMFMVVFVLWTARSLRSVWVEPHNISRTVAGLLAGIVWVDVLAVADQPRGVIFAFIALFAITLGFQRFVPPT
jgi:4-hydroxybenzoate polyprenyltransferase